MMTIQEIIDGNERLSRKWRILAKALKNADVTVKVHEGLARAADDLDIVTDRIKTGAQNAVSLKTSQSDGD